MFGIAGSGGGAGAGEGGAIFANALSFRSALLCTVRQAGRAGPAASSCGGAGAPASGGGSLGLSDET